MHPLLVSARTLDDEALLAAARRLVLDERRTSAELVAHLAEIEARDIVLREGYSSVFDYCRRGLGLSESEALGRIEAARAARRFPLVLDMLAAGELTMTTAMLLGRHLTEENHARLLREARGRSKDQLKELVAALAPKPPAATMLRRVPTVTTLTTLLEPPVLPPVASVPGPVSVPAPGTAGSVARTVVAVEPVAPHQFRYHVTIDERTRDLLNAARDLASNAGHDDSVLMHRALTLLVSMLARQKFADTKRPRKGRGTTHDSRHVAAEVKRVVWVRDGGRCAFVGRSGRRCEQRRFLEFHHVRPWQAGGESTVENIQLRCRAHNQYEARTYFTRGRVVADRDASGGVPGTPLVAGTRRAAPPPAGSHPGAGPQPPAARSAVPDGVKPRGAAPRPPSPGVVPGT